MGSCPSGSEILWGHQAGVLFRARALEFGRVHEQHELLALRMVSLVTSLARDFLEREVDDDPEEHQDEDEQGCNGRVH